MQHQHVHARVVPSCPFLLAPTNHPHHQSLAIPAILSGGDYLLAAQTGSGKTLAYLLPLIHALKAREGEPGMERRGKRPKVVVLAPTKELVEQVRVFVGGGG
jgi:superfamily II DNA/RNA helicase